MKENEQPQQTQGKLSAEEIVKGWLSYSLLERDKFENLRIKYPDDNYQPNVMLNERSIAMCNDFLNLLQQFNQPAPNEFNPPYRVGRKQKRAILDSNGLEVGVFKTGSESEAQRYCDYLNQQPAQVLSDSGIEELWDKYSEYIDDDIDSLQRIAGQSVVTRNSFIKSIQSLKGNGFSLGDVRKSISFGMEIQEGKHGNILIEDWINSLHSFPHT